MEESDKEPLLKNQDIETFADNLTREQAEAMIATLRGKLPVTGAWYNGILPEDGLGPWLVDSISGATSAQRRYNYLHSLDKTRLATMIDGQKIPASEVGWVKTLLTHSDREKVSIGEVHLAEKQATDPLHEALVKAFAESVTAEDEMEEDYFMACRLVVQELNTEIVELRKRISSTVEIWEKMRRNHNERSH